MGQAKLTWITSRLRRERSINNNRYFHVCCRQYVDDLRVYRDECNSVLSEVTQALSFLTELQSKYLNVSRKTNALHEACENLLEEQVSDTKDGNKNVESYFPFFDGAV